MKTMKMIFSFLLSSNSIIVMRGVFHAAAAIFATTLFVWGYWHLFRNFDQVLSISFIIQIAIVSAVIWKSSMRTNGRALNRKRLLMFLMALIPVIIWIFVFYLTVTP